MPSKVDSGLPHATSAYRHTEVAEFHGGVVHWDGKHGVIRAGDGTQVSFFPVHLAANGFAGDQLKVGDRVYFRCAVIRTTEYCLDRIRAVALA